MKPSIMRTITSLLAIALLCAGESHAQQIRNAQQVTVRIDGDCPMCEKTIERVGSVKGEAEVDWDVDAKTATIIYDSTRTGLEPILQRIAYAGYDNAHFLAPQEAYDGLPSCCQYERTFKQPAIRQEGHEHAHSAHDAGTAGSGDPHASHTMQADTPPEEDPLDPVFNSYFTLKDALVASDQKAAAEAAGALAAAIGEVPMAKLDHQVHLAWMKVLDPLKKHADALAGTSVLEDQRKSFKVLSHHMIELGKAAPRTTTMHLQHCPMYEGGSSWLSREKEVRNPYYGSQMLTCGSVKESIE
jgi:copper chaperone CopZ